MLAAMEEYDVTRRSTPSHDAVVWPARLDPSGQHGPTRGQARGRSWRRTSHGFYVPAHVPIAPEQRIVEAAVLVPEGGGITGWAGLRWCGGAWFDGLGRDGQEMLPVPLATAGIHRRTHPGASVSEEGLHPNDLIEVDGVRVTTALRSLSFAMRHAPSTRAAVVALDMAAYNDLVSVEEARRYAAAALPRTGVIQEREALELADENSWSPRETDLRLKWEVDAVLPRPLCNLPIFDRRGNHIGTPDILDPVAGVVGEYDGALHLEGSQRARDVRREEMFRRHDLEYFTMLAGDAADPTGLIDRMIRTRARAKFLSESVRPWTTDPPPWWTPTVTVEQRRSLSDQDRARLLHLRRQVG
jgi:hypothetical protein